ncbi:hypothetical protein MYX82_06705 [Acidobacteria bacterium AH-259-D05]|nr:hypothetical protein [Acidobacteria bacterium AH-259-D05]
MSWDNANGGDPTIRCSVITVTMQKVSLGLLVVAWLCLLFLGAILTVEHYDGYEYIMTGMTFAGESSYFFPKNPVLSSFFAFVYTILDLAHLDTRSLANYHLPILILNLSLSLIIAKWIKSFCPTLSIATIAAVICFNRSFFHYVPFALPDALVACSIGLWLYLDTILSMQSSIGKFTRIAILGLCALQRLQTVIIPASSIVTGIIRDRQRVASSIQIALGSVAFYLVFNTIFFYRGFNLGYEGGPLNLGTKPDLIQAITGQFAFLNYYFFDLVLTFQDKSSVWDYFASIFYTLTPVGTALLALGSFQLRKFYHSTQWSGLVGGVLIGSVCFFTFLLYVRTIGADRYITPLLPAFALIQCLGLAWLFKKRAMLGTLAVLGMFCFSVIPEFQHFYQPFYRADLERRAAQNIIRWSHSEPIYFTGSGLSPFLSKENIVHEFDPDFYHYGGMPAFVFFTRKELHFIPQNLTFNTYGFPIPDDLGNLVESDKTLIIPPMKLHDGIIIPWQTLEMPPNTDVTPLYCLRWSPGRTPDKPCSPVVQDICVEVYTPSETMVF